MIRKFSVRVVTPKFRVITENIVKLTFGESKLFLTCLNVCSKKPKTTTKDGVILMQSLKGEEKELVKKFLISNSKLQEIIAKESFIDGFKLGAGIIIDIAIAHDENDPDSDSIS